jgi:glutamate-1-semialdehyde 2,1-aminomutase
MGLVEPVAGFLEGLRSACDAAGAVLIFDEVITGFRLGTGGAQAAYGVTPDLTCLGKVIGGGLPIGAVGGRAEIMDDLAPTGPVYQAGTLSGNPLATAAGLAVLDHLDAGLYATLTARAERLAGGLEKALSGAGVPARAPQVGPLVGMYLGDESPTDYDAARRTDDAAYARFFHGLLDEGVAIAPGPYEVLFPGLAHTDDVVEEIVAAAEAAAARMG